MSKENKILTTEMILAKKGLIEKSPAPFHSQLFDADIIIENTRTKQVAEVLAGNTDDEMYMYSRLMFETCPIFREKALIEEYEVDDPYMLAQKIYGSNVIEFFELGNYILGIYGADIEKMSEKVKKK